MESGEIAEARITTTALKENKRDSTELSVAKLALH